jgi:hypothetical protein
VEALNAPDRCDTHVPILTGETGALLKDQRFGTCAPGQTYHHDAADQHPRRLRPPRPCDGALTSRNLSPSTIRPKAKGGAELAGPAAHYQERGRDARPPDPLEGR